MRKALAIVALTASLGMLVGCAQAPTWTTNGISGVGLTDEDTAGIDGFVAEIEEDGDTREPESTDYESFPGVPEECLAVYQPDVAFSNHSVEIMLNSIGTDEVNVGETGVFLYSDESGAKEDFEAYIEGIDNGGCLESDVVTTILGLDESTTVTAEKIDPHCATDCRMLQVRSVVTPSDGGDKIDRTVWFTFMQRGNAVIALLLYSEISSSSTGSSWFTVDQAVALANLQSAKFNSYDG
ncbi:hypothetical protein [Microbacterium sp. MPKO10]|uniref:hypothetical protein n=1 Tax=Microbacterium sp. MPKO10 TaxID=2989818 RepID=UPI0022361956|nr:hypothetical protein [Microbacterium sp. MPKO10]MCW4456951.1 hypothetical protein [Microbacterium sp. MPKO10]